MKVLSIEQMTKLKELGVDTDKASIRVGQMIFTQSDPWYGTEKYDIYLLDHEDNDTQCFVESYRAFNLQDVVELLPAEIQTNDSNYYLVITKIAKDSYISAYDIDLQDGSMNEVQFFSNDVLDAAYQMLIWVIENGYLKTK